MYISLISAHALGLSGMHFFTCIKVQWNGEASVLHKQKKQSENTAIYERDCDSLQIGRERQTCQSGKGKDIVIMLD